MPLFTGDQIQIPFTLVSGSAVLLDVTSAGVTIPSILPGSTFYGIAPAYVSTQSLADYSASVQDIVGKYLPTASYLLNSSSFNQRINDVYASESNYTSTQSLANYSASAAVALHDVYTSESNYLPTASYLPDSASFDQRIKAIDVNGYVQVVNYNAYTASNDARVVNVYASQSNYTPTQSFNLFTQSVNNFEAGVNAATASLGLLVANTYASESNYTPSASFNAYTQSVDSFIAGVDIFTSSIQSQVNNVYASESNYTPTQSFNLYSASLNAYTQSVNTQLINIYASESNYTPTQSFNTYTAANDIRVSNTYISQSNYLPTASYLIDSASLYTAVRTPLSVIAGTGLSGGGSVALGGSITLNNTITQYTDALARASISAGTGMSYNNSTGVMSTLITQYTDTLARAAISLTTTGASGSATYNTALGIFNIPTYTLAGLGGITATFLSATDPLLYNSATGVFSLPSGSATANGYINTTDWTNFNTAYTNRITTFTTTGSSGSATLAANALNIPTYTLAGLGGVPSTRNLTINGTTQDLSVDRIWNVGTVTSVGLSMPTAFSVASSPITGAGTLAVTGVGSVSQYIDGTGALQTFPTIASGGGGGVVWYFNGSTSQGTIGGNPYLQVSPSPTLGVGTNLTLTNSGVLAYFITDVDYPDALKIPAGIWNFTTHMSISAIGGTPTVYAEIYKYSGTTFTLLATSLSSTITSTVMEQYTFIAAIPSTTLLEADRIAIRIITAGVTGGKTVTMYTEDGMPCAVTTTFPSGIGAINNLSENSQYFAVGTTGSDFNISSVYDTHTFNIPTASGTVRGALSTVDWTNFNTAYNNRIATFTTAGSSGSATFAGNTLNIPTYTIGGLGGLTLTSLSATSPIFYDNTTGVISSQAATTSVNGYLTATDWTTFNGKLTSPMTTAGDIIYGGVTGLATRLGIGGANTVLHGGASAPSWGAIVEADITLSNNTTNNASTTKHGFLPILPNNATLYLNGQGNFTTPSGLTINNSYSQTGFSASSINIVHNWGAYPIVQVVDSLGAMVVPMGVTHNTLNDFTVTFSTPHTGTIIASVGGPQPQAVSIVNSNYTVLVTDRIVKVATVGITITLPTAVGNTGREYYINNTTNGNIYLVGTSSQTISGVLTQIIPGGSTAQVYSDGTNYNII